MTKLQFTVNALVFIPVCIITALFIAVNLIIDLVRYGKVRPCHE